MGSDRRPWKHRLTPRAGTVMLGVYITTAVAACWSPALESWEQQAQDTPDASPSVLLAVVHAVAEQGPVLCVLAVGLIFMERWTGRRLRNFARATSLAGPSGTPRYDERGPKELRELAEGLNNLFEWRAQLSEARERELIEERRRVAAELQDDTVQQLAGAQMLLELLQVEERDQDLYADVREALGAGLQGLQRSAEDIHPPGLEMLGLRRTVESLVENLQDVTGLPIVVAGNLGSVKLGGEADPIAYRVIRSLLEEVSAHLHGTDGASVKLALDVTGLHDGRSLLRVHLLATGMTWGDVPARVYLAAHEALRSAGGNLNVDRLPAGSYVAFTLPVDQPVKALQRTHAMR